MKLFRLILWVLPSLFLIPVHAAEPMPAAAFAARAKQTRERIELLFRRRNDAPTRINPDQNPFRTAADSSVPGGLPAATLPGDAIQMPVLTSDETLLKQAVATLKISGTFVVGGGGQIIRINQETYKEGSIITARVQGTAVYLRIRRITSNNVTFALNDAELVQPF